MSYTNIIANTKTQAHSIVPEAKDQTVLEKITNAQGTGITGSAIRKVAQFIGMDDLAPAKQEVVRGILSVDFEMERQQWQLSRISIGALEESERLRRQNDSTETVRKSHAFVVSKSILQSLQSPRKSFNYDRPVSRKFLNYIRRSLTAIEEIERQRRKVDTIGESAKVSLARQTSAAIFSGIQSPTLISTGHLTNVHSSGTLSETLGMAGHAAMKKILPAAELFAVSAYQIGNFAARAAYFFGGKAAVKAQDLGQKAAVKGQVLGVEAAIKGQQIGQQALAAGQVLGQQAIEKGQVLGQQAIETGQILGQKAAEEAQYLGNKAVSGAQALGQKAQNLTAQAAYSTVAGAQNLADQAKDAANNAVVGAQNLADQAKDAANNAVASAHNLADQAKDAANNAVAGAQELKANISAAVTDILEPTLSWKQLATLEKAERRSRIGDQFVSERFALALRTSALVKDAIVAQDAHYNPESEPRRYFGSFILEEMERMRRIASDKASPIAKTNARLAADIIRAYRQQTLSQQAQRPAVAYAVPAVVVKQVAVLPASPLRYQAAM